MAEYRLYRMNSLNKIIDELTFHGDDDEQAIAEAVRVEHAEHIEIWSGARMVCRVAPTADGKAGPTS